MIDGTSNNGLESLMLLPTTPADEFSSWVSEQMKDRHVQKDTASSTEDDTDSLSEIELRYLRCLVEHQGKPSSVYTQLAKIGHSRAQKIRRHLIELGYLRERKINTSEDGRGRMSIILEPLESVLQILKRKETE